MHDVLPPQILDTAAFRRLMGQFATGVCVVSVNAPDDGAGDTMAGITVNSFVSVSLEPRLVCWSLGNASSQFELWTEAPEFAISILAEDQKDLARRYAVRGSRELNPHDFVRTDRGLPIIDGALGYLECRQWSLYPAGDHTMVFGEVTGMHQATVGRPLTFYAGAFGQIVD
ncbi:MAG: flavin reductase family protein [Erythrobacter sp.]|nr:flavin reductase family protein [Erythrobacter sp.]